jgi:hypothetical protein
MEEYTWQGIGWRVNNYPVRKLNVISLSTRLTGFSAEMKGFFDPCVDKVVELIQGQIQQVERKKHRVKVNNSLPKYVKS